MKIFKNKNILITGGTGFVGSHLVEKLIELDAKVVVTYQTENPKSYFFSKKLDQQTIMANLDINHFEAIFDLITKNQIDYIFHLAAQPLVEVAFYNPRRTLKTNILGTINILESARLYSKTKAIIVASSDKAYGKTGKKKYLESTPLRGDHPYEVSKSAADLICSSYYKTYQLAVSITRFGNIYGEGDLNFSRIIPGMMQSLSSNQVLKIRSNGKYVRNYLYVKDVVDSYLLLAANINKVKGEAFNLGSKDKFSVIKLIKLVEKTLNKKLKYQILDIAKNEIPYQVLDYNKIKKILDWEPQYSLRKTIAGIYQWYYQINGGTESIYENHYSLWR
ncbi:MAG: GDP-mannose 4,6-dehydratase [Candidatus Woesebacteria bacterium]|jgi:CDP-glucose 4,6-dehydratase